VRVDRGGGVDPHFADRSDRVYFLERKQTLTKDPRTLVSTRLDGTKKREHAKTEAGVRMRISPDGRHIAWSERHRTWLAPWVETGKPVQLGPGKGGVPVVQLSRWSGFDLQWSGDSERLVWLLGPAMYERTVADAVAKLAGGDAKKDDAKKGDAKKDDAKKDDAKKDDALPLADAKIVRTPISFRAAHHAPRGRVAFVGGRVVTMDPKRGAKLTEQVIEDGVVLIHGGRIEAVGKRDEVAIPAGAKRFDARGMTIIPGLVDVHAHGAQGAHGITPERAWLLDAMLAFGVTTMHDPSNDSRAVFAARERVMAGLTPGPRIFSTGTILYGAMGHYHAPVDSVQDAVLHLFRLREMGAISVKSYNQPRRDQRQQVLAAARRLKMMVVPEGGALFQHNMTQVVDGHTGVEHALPVGRLHDDVLQLWSQTAVGWTPTLGVAYGGLGGEHYWYQHTRVDEHPRLRRFVRPDSLRASGRWPAKHAPEADYNHIFVAADCKRLVEAGGRVQLGAHGQREGLAAHWELWMLAQGGMTPLQALRAGTLDGARYLGMDGDIGSIAPGKLADLAIIEGDVTRDIRRSEHVRWTVAHGRVYAAATMAQLAPTERPAPTYFFSRADFGAGASDAQTRALGSCHGCDRH
jgi:imidazolonepropionase-like amidohydrolase